MANLSVPITTRQLRACLLCSLIKETNSFVKDGCDNCKDLIPMAGDREAVDQFTSKNFKGLVGSMDPENSWVAKWLHVDDLEPGMYAISVAGDLPRHVLSSLQKQGYRYRNRDRSGRKPYE
ncbi:transcription elongation factor SPT4-A-like [Teleopsis dalmanni]|uniref:transcription elongation factor SPT4-A-like n=1 Tax=Teleopsis dalmanni TaxID=139649 RepID=UPI0018CF957B|nr:transcription elongation factor SPT4-A-like [Teleopsis dalmanni]XP_037955659.1 transcription elongation factor SPT4-A-like [Teleopsis dalmanni]